MGHVRTVDGGAIMVNAREIWTKRRLPAGGERRTGTQCERRAILHISEIHEARVEPIESANSITDRWSIPHPRTAGRKSFNTLKNYEYIGLPPAARVRPMPCVPDRDSGHRCQYFPVKIRVIGLGEGGDGRRNLPICPDWPPAGGAEKGDVRPLLNFLNELNENAAGIERA